MNHQEKRQRLDRSHDPARVIAPSDGVFAIVICSCSRSVSLISPEVNNSPTL